MQDMCTFRKLPCMEYGNKEQLGRCIGREYRASLAIVDEQLAKAVQKAFEAHQQLNSGGNK